MSTALTTAEQQSLDQYEGIIGQGMTRFVAVGEALGAIRDKRLYRAAYATFEDYCKERWGMSARRAGQYIQAKETVGDLGTSGSEVKTERAARELGKVAPEKRKAVLEEASHTTENARRAEPVTAKAIKEAAKRVERVTEPAPLDGLRRPVENKALWPAFRDEGIKDLMRDLSDVKAKVKAITERPVAAFLNGQQLGADLRNVWEGLRFGQPYAPCVYCNGTSCNACRGQGWLPKGLYDAAPEEMK